MRDEGGRMNRITDHFCFLPSHATRGIRTHTVRILRPAPPAELGYRGDFKLSGSCRSRTCQAPCEAPWFSRPVPAPIGSELPASYSRRVRLAGVPSTQIPSAKADPTQRARQESNLVEPRLQLGRRPPATCSGDRQWVRQDSNLRSPKAPGLQPGAIAAPPHTREERDEGGRMKDESDHGRANAGWTDWRDLFHPSSLIPHPSSLPSIRLVRESNPCLRLDRAPC
jgi:hypothetical protein